MLLLLLRACQPARITNTSCFRSGLQGIGRKFIHMRSTRCAKDLATCSTVMLHDVGQQQSLDINTQHHAAVLTAACYTLRTNNEKRRWHAVHSETFASGTHNAAIEGACETAALARSRLLDGVDNNRSGCSDRA
jgi:hypothetical protein